ncbi:transcription initiation factor IIF, beta subunit-domain-containing protein [Trametes polyzona]|nr:transcription initiation factor IIF, beta subunit-domain-containing protein [Trametes polyzona]
MPLTALEEYSADIHGNYEDWMQPAPDASESGAESDYCEEEEDLMQVEPGDGKLLIVKIPKHLMERWSAIEEEGVHLATIRVYPGSSSSSGSSARGPVKPRVILSLPPEADDDRLGADEYEMEMMPTSAATPFNEYVVAEYDSHSTPSPASPLKGSGKKKSSTRRKRTALAGMVTHHCSLRAVLSERLRQRVKARTVAAGTPKRQIIYLGGGVRPLPATAPSNAKPFLIPAGCKTSKGAADKMTRLPRPDLLDVLFRLFAERPRWTFRQLRERTQQPEAYLKDVLPEIASVHRSGAFHGTWELSANFRRGAGDGNREGDGDGDGAEQRQGDAGVSGPSQPAGVEEGREDVGEDQDEEDDEDEEDLEEIF